MRPAMGDVMRVYASMTPARSTAARVAATSASASFSAAIAFSWSCRLTASIFTRSCDRVAFSRADSSVASARARAAFALSRSARYVASSIW